MPQVLRIKLVFFRTLYSQSGASLTMGSLAALLRNNGFPVDFCLLEKQNFHAMETVLSKNEGDNIIVIAKPNFKDHKALFLILRAMKERGRVSKIFLCGPFVSLNSKSIMQTHEWLDGIIMGEPESTGLELVKRIKDGTPVYMGDGGIWRNGTSVIDRSLTGSRLLLDDLPFPARDIERMESGAFINIEASRGCIYNCSFCHVPLMSGKHTSAIGLDVRDPVKVVDEMVYLYQELGKTLFIFNDSVFWASNRDNDRILKFCSEIKRRKLNDIRIYVYLRCNPFIDDNVLNALVEVGLVRVFLGVESASIRSQKLFKKPIMADSFESIKKKLDSLGINIHIGYIVFEPFATIEEVRSNIEYLHRMGKMFRLGTILEPVRVIPGSSMHRVLLEEGLMKDPQDYDVITYGYRFLNDEVGSLLRCIRNLFSGEFGVIAHQFEYYCTTLSLLKTLLERVNLSLDAGEYAEFMTIERRMEEDLLCFLLCLTDTFAISGNISDEPREFIDKFTKDFHELMVVYDSIVNSVRNIGGGEQLSQIYSGIERIN